MLSVCYIGYICDIAVQPGDDVTKWWEYDVIWLRFAAISAREKF